MSDSRKPLTDFRNRYPTPDQPGMADCKTSSNPPVRSAAYDYDIIVTHARLDIDTRNATEKAAATGEKIVAA